MKIQVTTRAKKDSFKEFGEKKAGRRGKSKMRERKRFRDMPGRCDSVNRNGDKLILSLDVKVMWMARFHEG